MNHWQILKKNDKIDSHIFDNQISLDAGYIFSFSIPERHYYIDKESRSGIFIFGYVTSRLNNTVSIENLRDLYFLFINNPERIADLIKGVFTIVLIINGKFIIFNDPFGISKFFYTNDLSNFAGRIHLLKECADMGFSHDNLLEYFVFNYNLNGNTFFRGVNYSTPATRMQLQPDGKITKKIYFDVVEHLSKPRIKIPKKEVFTTASQIWKSILRQWQQQLNGEKAQLSLTAGFDSRIILGGFIATYPNFSAFTFGYSKSNDVVYAKLLAAKYNITHRHCFPGKEFFGDFLTHARTVSFSGDTLVSIYRAHRLSAYNEIMKDSRAIFLGMGGSDLVRGFGYDGLIVSDIAWHCWNNAKFKDYLAESHLVQKLKNIGFNNLEFLIDRENEYQYLYHPLHYLFKVMIPLHFSQDVTMSMNHAWPTFLPFIDLDYLDLLAATDFFEINDFKSYKNFHYKRMYKGLYYSARLSNEINPKLSEFTIGKGYSPRDIVNSRIGFLIKGFYHKFRNRNKPNYANFSYGEWYWLFLENYLKSNDISEIGLKTSWFEKKLAGTSRKGGELLYLDLTKAVNIHLATQI